MEGGRGEGPKGWPMRTCAMPPMAPEKRSLTAWLSDMVARGKSGDGDVCCEAGAEVREWAGGGLTTEMGCGGGRDNGLRNHGGHGVARLCFKLFVQAKVRRAGNILQKKAGGIVAEFTLFSGSEWLKLDSYLGSYVYGELPRLLVDLRIYVLCHTRNNVSGATRKPHTDWVWSGGGGMTRISEGERRRCSTPRVPGKEFWLSGSSPSQVRLNHDYRGDR